MRDYYSPSESERAAIIAAYEAGESANAIGRKRGWDAEKVRFWLKRWSVPRRAAGFPKQSIEYNGIEDTLRGWARRVGITRPALSSRLKAGWPLDKALTLPKGPYGPKNGLRWLRHNDGTRKPFRI
jgi:hypothetical protein